MKHRITIVSALLSLFGCDGADPHITARKRVTAHVEGEAPERRARAVLDQHRPTHQTRDRRLTSPHAQSAECQSRHLCDQRHGGQDDDERSHVPRLGEAP